MILDKYHRQIDLLHVHIKLSSTVNQTFYVRESRRLTTSMMLAV